MDVAHSDAWEGAVARISADGPIRGLVAAAGILGPVGPLGELSSEQLSKTILVNLVGTTNRAQVRAAAPTRLEERAVTFSGGGGTLTLPRYDAYSPRKAGAVRLTEHAASDGEIDINSVARV